VSVPLTFVLAIDLGGTKVEAALVSSTGEVVEASRTRRPTGRETTPESLTASLREIIAEATADAPEIAGIGIGAAGPFQDAGTRVAPVNMPGLADGWQLPRRSTDSGRAR